MSPFHGHGVAATTVPGVFVTTRDSTRHLLSKDGSRKQIGFVDAKVAELVASRRARFNIEKVLAFSLKGGSVGLAESFEELSFEYDLIVLVDIGGDCFYTGVDQHVLSPMFDSICVRAFVDAKVNGFLFEAGPGTDGELEPNSLSRSLEENGGMANAHPLRPNVMDYWRELYTSYIESYRPGRTVPITLEAFGSTDPSINLEYRARAQLGDLRKYAYFTQTIDAGLCKKYYLVDPEKIVNPFAVRCTSPVDWFMKTQVGIRHTNNEANMQYRRLDDGSLWQFLTPSPLLAGDDREELLRLGLERLGAGVNDGAWIMPADWRNLKKTWEDKLKVDDRDEIILVSRK